VRCAILKGAAQRSDSVYIGGPVETGTAMALFRSNTKPDSARGCWRRSTLSRPNRRSKSALAGGKSADDLRVYVDIADGVRGQLG